MQMIFGNGRGRRYAIFAALAFVFSSASKLSESSSLPDRKPFFITPMLEGIFLCEEAINHNPRFTSVNEASEWCISKGYNSASLVKRKLDLIEPGGPEGKVQIGYEAGIDLLGLYHKVGTKWEIDQKKADSYIGLIANVNRPVVIYLMADHFSNGPLVKELAKDSKNLMLLKDGRPPIDSYFGNEIVPFTLEVDESIAVNSYRFRALRYMAGRIAKLPKSVRQKIVGITLAGEVHHIFPDFTHGGGNYKDIKVTDYSPRSVHGFQIWLQKKYQTISRLNSAIGSNFENFSDIAAPSKDVHKEKLSSFTEAYDSYAGGTVPIAGWIWDPKSSLQELKLYVDGKEVADIPYGLNRLDVYQAVPEVTHPNVGFRYDYSYKSIPAGRHMAQVVGKSKTGTYLLSNVEFVVVSKDQAQVPPLNKNNISNFKDAKEIKGLRS